MAQRHDPLGLATPATPDASEVRGRPSRPLGLRLLTIDEAAAQLGVPSATLYKLVARRLLASTRLLDGRTARIYIRETDLIAYVDARRQPASAMPPERARAAEHSSAYLVPPAQRRFS